MLLCEFDQTEDPITRVQLQVLGRYLDKLFAAANLDIEFTRHFMDRVNDARNRKQITLSELRQLFTKTYQRYMKGKSIAAQGPGFQGVLKDIETDVNLPFVLTYDQLNNEMDLIAKTIMRKRDFKSSAPGSGKILPV